MVTAPHPDHPISTIFRHRALALLWLLQPRLAVDTSLHSTLFDFNALWQCCDLITNLPAPMRCLWSRLRQTGERPCALRRAAAVDLEDDSEEAALLEELLEGGDENNENATLPAEILDDQEVNSLPPSYHAIRDLSCP